MFYHSMSAWMNGTYAEMMHDYEGVCYVILLCVCTCVCVCVCALLLYCVGSRYISFV